MPPPTPPEQDPLAPFRRPEEGTLDLALALVRYLRAHDPWDADQTPRSLVPFLLEEAAETAAAIRGGDPAALADELGDLLLNLAFQVVIGEETGAFDGEEVVRRLEEKMRRRHPHLFGQGGEAGWASARARERAEHESALGDEADRGLSPLLESHRMQQRASEVGFDWPDAGGALAKLEEEVGELRRAFEEGGARGRGRPAPDEVGVRGGGDPAPDGVELPNHRDSALEEELGDVLFAAVNVARLAGAHADDLLDRANAKFRRRFEAVERLARERSIVFGVASLEELDALWDEVKAGERGGETSNPAPDPPR